MNLLYYSPASYGGLADYAHEQANALANLGINVTVLCTPAYPTGRNEHYHLLPILQEPQLPKTHKLGRTYHLTKILLSNFAQLTCCIEENHFQYVLLGSYAEYLAPLWSGQFRNLAKRGVIFGAVVHDPVRDFVVGPKWWHRWSIACGYSFLQEAFVHEAIALDTVRPMPQLQTTVIPHGIYKFPEPTRSREEVRASLNIPLDAKVMLSFGHIRDGKNLDLLIRAMAEFPELYLVVAGKEQSSAQRPASFYQDLAVQFGVEQRCRWQIQFISDTEVANLFTASDLIALTYSSSFRSASGVLNAAVNYRKPCIASSGDGPLHSIVQKYKLGIWVEPNHADALIKGLQQYFISSPTPEWEQYLENNSWNVNAKLVMDRFCCSHKLGMFN